MNAQHVPKPRGGAWAPIVIAVLAAVFVTAFVVGVVMTQSEPVECIALHGGA